MTRSAALDHIAARVLSSDELLTLSDVSPPRMTDAALRQGLSLRGVRLGSSGTLFPAAVDPPPTNGEYPAFIAEVRRILAEGRPVDTDELLTRVALPDGQVPIARAHDVLRAAGLVRIPGIGWWTDPTWADGKGQIFAESPIGSEIFPIIRCMNTYGWPLHPDIIAERTWVSIHIFAPNRIKPYLPYFQNIGLRMIAPTCEARRHRVPMSAGVASQMLGISGVDLLTVREHRTAYVLSLLLGRAGLARVKMSNTRRSGKYMRTLRMELTDEGRQELERMAARTRAVEEVI